MPIVNEFTASSLIGITFMTALSVRHVTTYRYARPVSFDQHRLMLRPRDSHDLRLLSATLAISPSPARLRWRHDAFGNSVAVAAFDTEADTLSFDSTIVLRQYPTTMPELEVDDYARHYPFSYEVTEMPDLARSIERHVIDPDHVVDRWARKLIPEGRPVDTLALLAKMNETIHGEFKYIPREAEGVQTPAETLAEQSGTCRDFAALLIEAARALGFAARFVSGYLGIGGTDTPRSVGNATHAWAQLYLPGAGWLDFDPTNNIVGGHNLIRVAWAREPSQAIPIAGSWTGAPSDYLGMTVDVTIELLDPTAEGATDARDTRPPQNAT